VLPDFINIKKELSQARSSAISSLGDPIMSKIPAYRQHEGDRFSIFREDGSQDTSDQKLIRSEPITIDLKDVHSRGEQAIYESIAIARQQLTQASKRLLSEKLEEAPIPSMDAAGRSFTAELYLEMLEPMFLNFDEEGRWNHLDFWQENPNPRLLAKVDSELKRFESEPELRDQLETLLARKRQEWNDREANRKLVD
jgi:hypothetical protein